VQVCCGDQNDILRSGALQQVRPGDASWTRVGLAWKLVEPTRRDVDQFDWTYYDELFRRVAVEGKLKPVVIIEEAPAWASDSHGGLGPLKPGMLAQYLRFVDAAVRRYSRPPYNVHYWEIYNEPDGRPDRNHHVAQWGYDPLGYAALLKAVYPVIHAADPQAKVVVSPAYEWFTDTDPEALFVRDWFDRVIDPKQGNAGASFDVFGLHMYTFYRSVWDPYGPDILGKARFVKALMAKYGFAKPIIVTEMGQSAGAYGDPELQARYLVQGTVRSLAANSEVVIWFSLGDFDEWKRGLVDEKNQPRPAVAAAAVMNRQLAQPVFRDELKDRASVGPNVEGYFFATASGEVLVAWVDDESTASLTRSVSLPGVTAWTVDRGSATKRIDDADDGRRDGQVTLALTREPLFVRITGGAAARS
jgi:hypothetical protein